MRLNMFQQNVGLLPDICSLIKPAFMEKLTPFPAQIHTVRLWWFMINELLWHSPEGNFKSFFSSVSAPFSPDSRTIIEDWDCSMPSDPSAWKHTISSGSTEDLLRGFFEFYANLDFSSSVLCMRSGRRVDIAEFRESMRETPQLEAFKVSPRKWRSEIIGTWKKLLKFTICFNLSSSKAKFVFDIL